jgi:uncharacterized damage-inducible protein DinB
MTANEARTHLRYSGWASRKLMDAAKSLNPDDLTRSTGVSHGSIEGTLSHIHFADRIWYSRVVDMNEPVIKQASFAELEQQWPAIQQKWEAWADSLQDADLDRVLSYSMTDGTARQSVLSHILMHVVNHATLHRGQAVGMIRQLGIKPPTTDLMAYYRETAAEAGAR